MPVVRADIFNFLDQHQGASTAILTAVLISVTIYYAWQNRKMVKEMAATREVAVLPKVAIEWTMMSSVVALPTLHNVGPGPALRVDVAIHYEPLPGQEHKLKVRKWTANLMASGETKQFLPLEDDFSGSMNTEEMAKTYSHIALTGECYDVLGKKHTVEDRLEDIAEWRRISGNAIARWLDPDAQKRQAKENADALEPLANQIVDAIKSLGSGST
jgi:hypothetical protein